MTRDGDPSVVHAAKRVLVVDDEAPVRKVVRLMLERLGYRVLEAANGAEAIGVLESSLVRIDLILTDLVMPELHGGQLGAFLAEDAPSRRVLYMTGYASDEIMRLGLTRGDRTVLKKPFTPESLARAVRQVLDGVCDSATAGIENGSAEEAQDPPVSRGG